MPNQSRTPSSRDAQDVDRLLRKLILEEEAGLPPDTLRPKRPTAPPKPALPAAVEVWAWVGLGGVLAGALTQWPYDTCGLPLAAYLVGAALVLVTGASAAFSAWRARLGFAHILAIVLLFAGTALVAHQVLPRVGYTAVEATWRCPG